MTRRLLMAILLTALMLAWSTPVAAQGGGGRGRGGGRRAAPPAPSTTAPADASTDGKKFELTFLAARDAVNRGEGRAALGFYESVAADAERRGAPGETGSAYACVAFVSLRLSQLQKALTSAHKALDLLRNDPDPSNDHMGMIVSVYSALGNAYRNSGDRVQARKWYEEGLGYARAGVSPRHRGAAMWVAGLLKLLAQISYQDHAYATARDQAQEAATLSENFVSTATSRVPARAINNGRRHAADSLTLLAKAQLALGDKDAAEAALTHARQYARLVGLVEVELEILTTAGQIALARNEPGAALSEFQKAIPQAERIGRIDALVQLHQLEAHGYAALGRAPEAVTAVRRAMDLIEEIRGTLQESALRSEYVEDKQGIYQFAVRVALRSGNPADAFAFAERARARAFLDLLGNSTTLSKGRTRALVQEEVQLRARLAEARALASDGEESEGDR